MPGPNRSRDVAEGILPVDKPEGPTSHDVVDRARRSTGWRRMGHTGTLDPFATGLLLLCVGEATRLASLFHDLAKRYEARVILGAETETDDLTGRLTRESVSWRDVREADIRRLLDELPGPQLQTPPAYSAKKVRGRRAYEAARAGEPLELSPTEIRVFAAQLRSFEPPAIDLTLVVSTGTYVRALARDLGRDLGCLAHLGGLRRTAIGPFSLDRAVSWLDLSDPARVAAELIAPAAALSWIPARRLSEDEARRVSHGAPIGIGEIEPPRDTSVSGQCGDRVMLLAGNELVAIGRRAGAQLMPEKVLRAG